MSEIIFCANRIDGKNDSKIRWEVQFKLIDECAETVELIDHRNFTFRVGEEDWELSAGNSNKQKMFNKNGAFWYIKGGNFEPVTKHKYKNISQGSMHDSYAFIDAIITAYPEIKQNEYRGYFSRKDKCMFITCPL